MALAWSAAVVLSLLPVALAGWLPASIAAAEADIDLSAAMGPREGGNSAATELNAPQQMQPTPTSGGSGGGGGGVDFGREVLPILSDHCFHCHGPDQASKEAKDAGFRLDDRDDAMAMFAIVPGDAAGSSLIDRVSTHNAALKMPPTESTKPALSDKQIETLTQWINEGAKYEKHWAFVKPQRPEVPDVSKTAHANWVVNDIDAFVLAKLVENGLTPSEQADKHALIRRVSLDLTGLPPTVDEVDAFVNDPSNDAYEKLVDRLLASPHFGEHWARQWLDKARYADSQGFEKDRPRTMWRYRDWVVDAYNRDMPFDAFTKEQIAGDLLPNATLEQRIATGFHRNTMNNTEGGTDNEEYRAAAVIDRVNTTMSVWMGVTMGCVQCHTHKYDPIQHVDYYRMYAFFNQTADADTDDDAPFIQAPTREQSQRLGDLRNEIDGMQAAVLQTGGQWHGPFEAWQKRLLDDEKRWANLRVENIASEQGSTFALQDDGSVLPEGRGPEMDSYTVEVSSDLETISAIQLQAMVDGAFPRQGPGRADNGNFVVSNWSVVCVRADGFESPVALGQPTASFDQNGYGVVGALDQDLDRTGWAIDPRGGQPHAAVFAFEKSLALAAGDRLKITIRQNYGGKHTLGRFRLRATGDALPVQAVNEDVLKLLQIEPSQRNGTQNDQLVLAFAKASPGLSDRLSTLENKINAWNGLEGQVPTALVMQALPEANHRTTYLFNGGSFLAPNKQVGPLEPGTPPVFQPFPQDAPHNRLGLSDWLTDPDNPLTARVQVNRIWEQLFGTGLVETTNDFGTQASYPSNKALLDDLAIVYQNDLQWSTKALLRLIVTSATYKQSSQTTPHLLEVDPNNRLLARGPRGRLSAEQIRDQALFVSGLLNDQLGGPPVVPYLPAGLLSQGGDNGRLLMQSQGGDLYRRALYTEWRRTGHYPSFATFDAPSRESCTVKRSTTNTPLQALVTLNDPVYVEAAQALARVLIEQAGDKLQARFDLGFQRVLARSPKPAERQVLANLYQAALADYASDQGSAVAMATDPRGPLPESIAPADAAAMTVVCNVLLNLDETLNKP